MPCRAMPCIGHAQRGAAHAFYNYHSVHGSVFLCIRWRRWAQPGAQPGAPKGSIRTCQNCQQRCIKPRVSWQPSPRDAAEDVVSCAEVQRLAHMVVIRDAVQPRVAALSSPLPCVAYQLDMDAAALTRGTKGPRHGSQPAPILRAARLPAAAALRNTACRGRSAQPYNCPHCRWLAAPPC